MAQTINTNVASLNAQRNLNKSQNGLSTSLQRLSSGLRINSAKDDAAGLQISNKLTSQINGLNVASRNANDGISLAQTAEGAMQEGTNILQRMRELALQSANGTNSDEERAALNAESIQLKNELDRIATTTRFGGKMLLDGNFNESIQVGARANETISISVGDFRTTAMGTRAERPATAAISTGTAAPTSLKIGATTTAATPGSAAVALTGLNVPAGTTAGPSLSINGTTVAIAADADAAGFVTAINAQTATTGVSVANNSGTLTFSSTTGNHTLDLSNVGLGTVNITGYAAGTPAQATPGSSTSTGTFSAAAGDITVGGQTITLAATDDTVEKVAQKINDANIAGYTAEESGGQLLIANSGGEATATLTTVGLTLADSTNYVAAGTPTAGTATAAAANFAVTTTSTPTTTNITVGGSTVALSSGDDGAAIANKINAANITGYSATFTAEDGLTISNSAGDVANTNLNSIGLSAAVTSTNFAEGTAANNASFTMALGAGAAQTLTLADGTYTAEGIADEINRQINANATLKGNVRASVNEGKIEFKTTGTGANSSITLGEVADAGTTTNIGLANLGMTAGTTSGQDAGAGTSSVESINISTASGAQNAVSIIDAAIAEIDQTRGDLGAIQNRMESTISNLSNISENVSAARSRILDTDFAAETANMTKNQILQQAGISVLSQANSLPQQVLSLLQ